MAEHYKWDICDNCIKPIEDNFAILFGVQTKDGTIEESIAHCGTSETHKSTREDGAISLESCYQDWMKAHPPDTIKQIRLTH